ncbi:glutathione S-transferase [Frigidibacter albus]|uniref:Glutathione S-transferase n=1 Tax=Frigidibacter albus TaxID=1465486 RepID=A0A6L8VIQ9_9RHOB|nr:glutathione S-transferase family protein [Frigidibacter albus]MZQ89651.1 glutathione S-transferase [Frigidibacter albus]NBE31557.1 glutathione S-transferase [Frigidibacter albus]GGH54862.1 glutathione S-transferase [Frigidibacter albus]
MLTLFHAPQSRSSRLVTLIDEMGLQDRVKIQTVTIPRVDGTGQPDAANPHPERKVPALLHDGTLVTETAAVILYLTGLFPETGLAPQPGDPRHGAYLTWLFWYGNVVEPVLLLEAAGISHPYVHATLRGHPEIDARLRAALDRGPWLLGDSFTAADLLCHSPYAWWTGVTPDDPAIRDWVARCEARPAAARTREADEAAWLGQPA